MLSLAIALLLSLSPPSLAGLYGFPVGPVLNSAVAAMTGALAPGGTLVVAISNRHLPDQQAPAFYDRVSRELVRGGYMTDPYANATDVEHAFVALAQKHAASAQSHADVDHPAASLTTHTLQYDEVFDADDTAGLKHFVLEESGLNSFTVDDGKRDQIGEELWDAILPKLEADCLEGDKFVFEQRVRLFVYRAPSTPATLPSVAPDMLSDHRFYTDAYALRRAASTMQVKKSLRLLIVDDNKLHYVCRPTPLSLTHHNPHSRTPAQRRQLAAPACR